MSTLPIFDSEKELLDKEKTSSAVSSSPPNTFLSTSDFLRYLLPFVSTSTLPSLLLTSKQYHLITSAHISLLLKLGTLRIHSGVDSVKSSNSKRVTSIMSFYNIHKIGDFACSDLPNLLNVDIPFGVNKIGKSSFRYCKHLQVLQFPTSLEVIDSNAFTDCTSLKTLNLRTTKLTTLGSASFYNCSSLSQCLIPETLVNWGSDVFYNRVNLVEDGIDVNDEIDEEDVTCEVIDYLRTQN